jgi:hypothetical protein
VIHMFRSRQEEGQGVIVVVVVGKESQSVWCGLIISGVVNKTRPRRIQLLTHYQNGKWISLSLTHSHLHELYNMYSCFVCVCVCVCG